MLIHLDYSFEERLKSLSERIKYTAKEKNEALDYTDSKIKAENLRYNLSLSLAHIIVKLNLIDRSRDIFEQVINTYNQANNCQLTFDDFYKINWVRVVSNEVVLPVLVRQYVWKVGYYEEKGDPIQIPADKEDIVRCLQTYYQQCFEKIRPSISERDLKDILKNSSQEYINIAFLLKRKILTKGAKGVYLWQTNEYTKHLRNEIASTIWILLGINSAAAQEFEKFMKISKAVELYNYNFSPYLSNIEREKISKLAFEFLENETDFIKTGNEFRKIWLDTENYHHLKVSDEIPSDDFSYDSTYNFIQSVAAMGSRYQDLFSYQGSRSHCHQLFKNLLTNEPLFKDQYKPLLFILKDLSRPFLLWMLYKDISKNFPEVIPYLLNDTELAPIAFKLLDKLGINPSLTKKYSEPDLQNEESYTLQNKLYNESFDLLLDIFASTNQNYKEKGVAIAQLLLDMGHKVFKYNSNDKYISHNAFRKRYDATLSVLGQKRLKNFDFYPHASIYPRLVGKILPAMLKFVLYEYEPYEKKWSNEYIRLDFAYLDVAIELLKLGNLNFTEGELENEEKTSITLASSELTAYLFRYLIDHYTLNEVQLTSISGLELESKKVKRGLNSFGFEIIDWGYLFLLFERNQILLKFYDEFISSLIFSADKDEYDEHNMEQSEKLKPYVKSLLLGYISINLKRSEYEIKQLPVKETLSKLERWIQMSSINYSVDKLYESRINIFEEKFYVFGKDLYYSSLRTLLFQAINFFEEKEAPNFITRFFEHSIDIGSMLTACNLFERKDYRSIVSERISSIEIDEYIESRYMITDLQDTLVEAINSETHWDLAKHLIERVQKHLEQHDRHNDNSRFLLFNVMLLLAFKERDIEKLDSLEIPKKMYSIGGTYDRAQELKIFYNGLHRLYNEKNYDLAIIIFQSLLSKEDKPRYAFHLYRAQTLKAKQTDDTTLIGQAFQDWESFTKTLTGEKEIELAELREAIASNQLNYFALNKDYLKFDQNLNTLSKPFLYDEEIIPMVYEIYIQRGLDEAAFSYIMDATTYMTNNGSDIPDVVKLLKENSSTHVLLDKLKQSLVNIRGLKASSLPSITPDVVNDRRNLNDFVLNEFVQASKVMIDKIHGIKTIPHEDRFNDLLLAILRLRFQIWGWSIHDQARKGNSPKGKSAGETDVTIECGNITFALIEALILKGKNLPLTRSHVTKMFSYAKNLERYYVVVYFRGKPAHIDKTWVNYKKDVTRIKFKSDFSMDIASGFIDLSKEYDDINHLRLAKTYHTNGVEVYHMMIDLSE